MHFTHYQKAGDKVFAANPFISPDGYYHVNSKFHSFETWLSKQPPIYADPSIKDGVYAKELFDEPVWQYLNNSFGGTWIDINFEDKNSGFETRLYIRLKQPVKQEEKLTTISDQNFEEAEVRGKALSLLAKRFGADFINENAAISFELINFYIAGYFEHKNNPLPHDNN